MSKIKCNGFTLSPMKKEELEGCDCLKTKDSKKKYLEWRKSLIKLSVEVGWLLDKDHGE